MVLVVESALLGELFCWPTPELNLTIFQFRVQNGLRGSHQEVQQLQG